MILDKFGRIPDFQFPVAGFFLKEDIMTAIKAFIKQHPVATYFALTFAISTGGILIAVAREGLPLNVLDSWFAALALFAGPSVAGLLLTGLVSGRAGLMFAAWDFLVVFWVSAATSTAGALPMAIFMPAVLFTWLPAYRVLMVWVYERTNESLLVAMLMHTSLVAFWTSLTPLALVGMTLVTYYLVFTAALWGVVAAVAVAQGGHLSRQPLRTRVT